jgi:hypothetical protein
MRAEQLSKASTVRRRRHLLALLEIVDDTGEDYFICSGTLLGFVRHGGFIPWDSDVDVSVKLESMARLCAKLRRIADERSELRISNTAYGAILSMAHGSEFANLDIFVISQIAPTLEWAFAGPVFEGRASFLTHSIFPSEVYSDVELFPTCRGNFDGLSVRVPRRPRECCFRAFGMQCLRVAKLPRETWLTAHNLVSTNIGLCLYVALQDVFLSHSKSLYEVCILTLVVYLSHHGSVPRNREWWLQLFMRASRIANKRWDAYVGTSNDCRTHSCLTQAPATSLERLATKLGFKVASV